MAEVFILGVKDLAAEVEQPGLNMPLSALGGAHTVDLKELPCGDCNRIFKVRVAGKGLSDVMEDGHFRSGNDDAFQRESGRGPGAAG